MKCVISILALCLLPPGKMKPEMPMIVNDYCEVSETIIASRRDTAETLRQVLRENTKRRRMGCKNPG